MIQYTRFLKIGVPSYFLLLLLIISYYTSYWERTDDIVRILTFRFNGIGSVDGIGALWYISSLMQLFLLTPFLCFVISKVYKKFKSNLFWGVIVGIIIVIGLLYRILLSANNFDWYKWIYTFSISNLDIYICGLICNILCFGKRKESPKCVKGLICVGLFLVIISNIIVYYFGNSGNANCLKVYQNVYPSVYIIILSFYVIGYHNSNAHKNKYSAIIAKISGYTFWFYLWHSFVLHQIYEQISITGIMMTHLKLLLCGAVISLGLSVVFENACSLLLKPLLYRVQNYEGSIGKLLLQFLMIPTCSVGMVLGFSACNSWGIFYKNAYPQFLGNGSLETPYLIQNKDDLEMLRDMVNEGEEFKDIFFFQTRDINLENEEWIPIGIYDSGNYFRGTYDGGGHVIENLCITRAYSTPSNVGFFGILAGTVKNFGIESGYIEGDCVGGITSHGAESALILNCYNKAYIKGTARAGGICDNLCDGSLINCVNIGQIEAPNTAQLVSYNAKRIIACHLDQGAFTDCFEGGLY